MPMGRSPSAPPVHAAPWGYAASALGAQAGGTGRRRAHGARAANAAELRLRPQPHIHPWLHATHPGERGGQLVPSPDLRERPTRARCARPAQEHTPRKRVATRLDRVATPMRARAFITPLLLVKGDPDAQPSNQVYAPGRLRACGATSLVGNALAERKAKGATPLQKSANNA